MIKIARLKESYTSIVTLAYHSFHKHFVLFQQSSEIYGILATDERQFIVIIAVKVSMDDFNFRV